ncbi:beta strand repeat-containing protein, partial [Glycocaulis alkaliphilus]
MSDRQSGTCGTSRNDSAFVPVIASRRPAPRLRAALMGATMLAGAVSAVVLAPQDALAQEIVDGGDHAIVDGDGPGEGAPASNRPGAWILGGSTLSIGGTGAGSLTIRNGGRVENLNGAIADFTSDSTGTVTVTGAGSEWVNNGSLLFVGREGNGALTIEDGARVRSTTSYIGMFSDATGAVSVAGAGAEWINSDGLFVGVSGNATLTIADGGDVSAASVVLAYNDSSSGTLNIGAAAGDAAVAAGTLDTPTIAFGDGGGTIVFNHTDNDFELEAGISGNGTIRLLAGRTTLSGNNTYTGSTLLEGGTLTLGSDNALGGSTLRTTGSVVDYANGVNIANSIIIDSNTTQFQVFTGSATQSGVISQASGPRPFQKIGDGELILTAANTWTGHTTISAGALTFDGGSVALAAGQDFYVGRLNGDNGTLNISNGGAVSNRIGYIGDAAGSTGAVTVTGAGSQWINSVDVKVGNFGDGTLTISDGGAVGRDIGSVGVATVTGTGSEWINSADLFVGFDGQGTLTIENGGSASSLYGYIGNFVDATGDVTVTGADSTWTIEHFLRLGAFGGNGTLTIADGGEVSAGSVTLAGFAGGTGTMNIGAAAGDAAVAAGALDSDTLAFWHGSGRLVFNHTASLGGTGHVFGSDITSSAAGDALIRQLAGFTRLTGDSAGYQGDVDVSGGRLSVDGVLGSGDVTASVSNGGALTGSGTLDGDVTIGAGGILAGQSGQTLTITGDLTLQGDGAINVALGAPGGAELFAVGGDLTLDGLLNISDAGGFGPGLYALLTYGGALTDNGFAIGAAPGGLLPGELQLQTSVAGQVNLVSNIGVDLLFWDGDDPANALNGVIDGGDGVWSATSFTFTDADGLVSGPSRPTPGFIVFSGAAGHVTADDSEGAIEIAGAQFAVDGYVIDGDAITLAGNGDGDAIFRVGNGTGAGAGFTATIGSDLGGDAALVLTDLGTLILTGTNSYTGGTEVRSGTLIGSTSSIMGDIANNGVVVFDQAGDAVLNQSLSGDGLFRFTGGAQFT